MSNHSIIEHRANYHYVKLEEDYVLICSQGKQYPHCKAFILATLEHWANDKIAKGQSPSVYMTYPQWIDALYGLFHRNHIISCLEELVQEKLVLKQPCRLHGKDTFQYSLNVAEVKAQLSKLPEKAEKYCRPNINAFKFKRVEKQTGVNLNGSTHPNLNAPEGEDAFKDKPNIDSITEIPSNIDSKREVGAHAPTAPSSSSSDSNSQDDEDTQKKAAIQKPLTAASNKVTSPPADKKPSTNPTVPAVKPVIPPKRPTQKPVTMPSTPEEKAFQARCAYWYKRITEWCGGPMTRAGAVINEHKAIKALCEQWSDKEIGDELEYLTTKDWKWSKIDNKYKVRAYVLLEEAGAVKRILDNPQAKSNGHSPPQTGNASQLLRQFGIKPVEAT